VARQDKEKRVKKGVKNGAKQGTLLLGIIIPVTLITLTLVVLILMNQAHASLEQLLGF